LVRRIGKCIASYNPTSIIYAIFYITNVLYDLMHVAIVVDVFVKFIVSICITSEVYLVVRKGRFKHNFVGIGGIYNHWYAVIWQSMAMMVWLKGRVTAAGVLFIGIC